MILPGWGDTRNTFQFLAKHLKQDYTIYIFDYPGFGNSPPIHRELTIEDYSTIFYDFLDEHHIKNPIIIAHSFGGRIASILLGRYHIPVRKVILMDVAGIKRRKLTIIFKTIIYKILKSICLILRQHSLLKKIRFLFSSNDYHNIPPYMYKTFQNIIHKDLRDDYSQIHSDVLIIWGENDPDTPLKDAFYLHKVIQNSGLIVYPHSGHFSYLDQPYLTLRILQSFLDKKDMD